MNFIFFRAALLDWYHKNKRDLPWRQTTEPYKIWISEIILQQTTVEQGRSYYLRFIDKYEDIFALANATERDVLKLWQGLGYYTRARNMHKTAQLITNEYGGKFPEAYSQLLKLKGIGPYTAAAMASFCFNKPHPVSDGNVIRVISRLFSVEKQVNTTDGLNEINSYVQQLFDTENPAAYNQAIMEFGAMLCKVRNPLCNMCFASAYCIAFKKEIQNTLPLKLSKKAAINRFFIYIIPLINIKGEIYTYIKKRTEKDIWHNLYEFILFETKSLTQASEYCKDIIFKRFLKENNIKMKGTQIALISDLIMHKLTHQTIQGQFIICKMPDFKISDAYLKIKFNRLNDYPLPKLIERFIETSVFNAPN